MEEMKMEKKKLTVKISENGIPEDAWKIREMVFMKEQGFQNELDELDDIAAHIVLYDEEQHPAGVCRVFQDVKAETYILGRLAVVKNQRGNHFGEKVVREAEKFAVSKGAKVMKLHAQCRASAFYERLGYCAYGEIEEEEGCPHIWMKTAL